MSNYREDRPGAGLPGLEQSSTHQRSHNELVADAKAALTAAQQDWEGRNGPGTFDPVMWAGERLTKRIFGPYGEEEAQRRSDLSLAWDAITLPYLRDDAYRDRVDRQNTIKVMTRESNTVSLSPPERALIDVMTDAIGIPHQRGQESVEILQTDKQKRNFKALYGSIHASRCGIT